MLGGGVGAADRVGRRAELTLINKIFGSGVWISVGSLIQPTVNIYYCRFELITSVSVLAQPQSFSRFKARKRTSLPVLTNPTVMRPAVMSKSVVVIRHRVRHTSGE